MQRALIGQILFVIFSEIYCWTKALPFKTGGQKEKIPQYQLENLKR